jgi:hypothetical protein
MVFSILEAYLTVKKNQSKRPHTKEIHAKLLVLHAKMAVSARELSQLGTLKCQTSH